MVFNLEWWRSLMKRSSGSKPLRIGIFEGAFNPPHYGHLLCALFAQQELNLDFVYFVPLTNPPHKRDALDADSRFDMVVAAVAENPYFRASRVAIEHGGTGYSLMTVEAIHNEHPDAELFYLTSSEYLDPAHKYFLGNWIGGKELFGKCRFVVFPRGDHKTEQIKQWAKLVPQAKIDVVDLYSPEVSSTHIRQLVSEGKSIRYLTPFDIQTTIYRERHYHTQDTPRVSEPAAPVSSTKRLALFGGQFNPITYGDLWMAEWLRQKFAWDRVMFITTAQPPNRTGTELLDAELRHQMVTAAVASNPHFSASRIELDRRTTSYTYLTIEQMRQKFGDQAEINWLISADYLNPQHPYYLPKWMGMPHLFEMCRFIAFPLSQEHKELAAGWTQQIENSCPQAQIEFVPEAPLPIVSASLIRRLVVENKSIWYTCPWPVQQIINNYKLYRNS